MNLSFMLSCLEINKLKKKVGHQNFHQMVAAMTPPPPGFTCRLETLFKTLGIFYRTNTIDFHSHPYVEIGLFLITLTDEH